MLKYFYCLLLFSSALSASTMQNDMHGIILEDGASIDLNQNTSEILFTVYRPNLSSTYSSGYMRDGAKESCFILNFGLSGFNKSSYTKLHKSITLYSGPTVILPPKFLSDTYVYPFLHSSFSSTFSLNGINGKKFQDLLRELSLEAYKPQLTFDKGCKAFASIDMSKLHSPSYYDD